MTTETLSEALQSPLGQRLEPRHFSKLMAMGTEVDFRENDIVFREDEECRTLYLLLSGTVALEAPILGRLLCVQKLHAGDELGWASLLMGYGRHFQARCLSPVRAMAFDGAILLDACNADPAFGFALMYRLLEVVAGRLEATRVQLLQVFDLKLKIA
jgi:CRP/FNR family cyclic AMP-dependent transcriptional regulator